MENALVRITSEESQGREVLKGFLKTLRGMLRNGYRPQSYLLVCLTDGRTKVVAVGDTGAAGKQFASLRNEYGPLRNAFYVEVTGDETEPTLRIEDLVAAGKPRVEQKTRLRAGVLTFQTPTWQTEEPGPHSRDCKNSAIFFGSFGITTGWLPNVDSSFSPPDVAS